MKKNSLDLEFRVIPIEQIHADHNQPRKEVGDENDRSSLKLSIEKYGIETPLSVSVMADGQYKIIDGHRRYFCAKDLGLKKITCRVYPGMSEGEFESRRFEIQNNRKSWRPLERAMSLSRIRQEYGFKTNRELADHVHMSETPVANSMQLKNEQISYLEMMAKLGLRESYQTEFIRLKPKLRKIKEIDIFEIIEIIFRKVSHQVIKTSRDFRKLGRVFKRATANEKELYRFLKDPDMTVEELSVITDQSGFMLLIEELMNEITEKKTKGEEYTAREEEFLKKLLELLNETL